jgi:CheY-like chemotaxis protein
LDRLSEEIKPALVGVLSDIYMPGMDGLALLGEIKQRRPDLPVMMVTAYGDDVAIALFAALPDEINEPIYFLTVYRCQLELSHQFARHA